MSRGLCLAGLLALGCAGEDEVDAFCQDAPVVTYASFGQDFLRENCQSCHASGSAERNGAPDWVVFDTEEDAIEWADRILERAGSDPPTMPPRGGLNAEDQQRLEVWLRCG